MFTFWFLHSYLVITVFSVHIYENGFNHFLLILGFLLSFLAALNVHSINRILPRQSLNLIFSRNCLTDCKTLYSTRVDTTEQLKL